MPSSIGAKSCSSFNATWSIAPKPPTCSSCLQPVHQVKSCLDLLHLDHMTQCHVSSATSSFIITCVSFATSLIHFHLHGICCSHTCTCELITCVSHINTISPPRLSLNYQNHIGTFHPRRTRGHLTSNRARGENADEPRAALAQSVPEQTGSSQTSHSILTSSHAHRISIEGRPAGHPGRSPE